MENFFPHIDLEYYVFLDLTENSKSDVDVTAYVLSTHSGGYVESFGTITPIVVKAPNLVKMRLISYG